MELPTESEVFSDWTYTNYKIEDQKMECDQIDLKSIVNQTKKEEKQR